MQTYEDLIRNFMVAWQNIRRWRGKPKPKKEDVLMHEFKECMNTIYALSLEKDSPKPINNLQVLTAKLFHDIGEGLLGCDIPYPIKTDKQMCGVFDEIEKDEIELFLNLLPIETKNYLKTSLRVLDQENLREGKLCNAIEYYGYISFAFAEIKTEGKGNSNVVGFHRVLLDHGDKFWKYLPHFQFVKKFKEITERLEKEYFSPDIPLLEFTLRKIIDVWTNPELGRAWPNLETDENLLERTMKTAFLAAFLIPQELSFKTRINGYKILCAALVHKLDKIDFPVLAPNMRKNKKLRKHERAFRKLQREHFIPIIADYPPETREIIEQAYLLERDRESIDGRFFDAIKNLSYVLFGHYEFTRGKKEFYQVFKNCDEDLTDYCKEFKSIKEIYEPVKKDFERKEKNVVEELRLEMADIKKENAELKKKIEDLGKKTK